MLNTTGSEDLALAIDDDLIKDFVVKKYPFLLIYPLFIIGVRHYTRNESYDRRNQYNDLIIQFFNDEIKTYPGNTHPSTHRMGFGQLPSKGMFQKGMATLKPGLYVTHKIDYHRNYIALCQRSSDVTVVRDGNPPYEDTGLFSINIHKGGKSTTSSEGCQTIWPDCWDEFIETIARKLVKGIGLNQSLNYTVPYLLVNFSDLTTPD
ncbi:hypothetical protein [Acidithiobacillus thiooxidans]|uniref:Uncharacterized protein n=1 Tax=Acidithiobacillus thiooxidans ATCC 19377 TaxID=637390 RepID=A0A543Q006_ACITH|nr:hypothetical protein [Acidithiobacillus thiooxidans]MDX5936338.1 hypothetical protein [Acidithiobacillus thiooxidans]TQN49665.1 hypothetical protein DLNHIDIE_03075 [Acidithiobacillus thiooxidans ATCC 19377]